MKAARILLDIHKDGSKMLPAHLISFLLMTFGIHNMSEEYTAIYFILQHA